MSAWLRGGSVLLGVVLTGAAVGRASLAGLPAVPSAAEGPRQNAERQQPKRGSEGGEAALTNKGESSMLALLYSQGAAFPTQERVLVKEGHVVCYNQATRNAVWVAQRLRKRLESEGGGGEESSREESSFVEDAEIPAEFRSRLGDYRCSGYDRGHLASA